MAPFRLDLIGRYLKPHRSTVLMGAIALVVVNILSVTIPLEIRRVIDDLQEGFAFSDVLAQAGWIVLLATSMGVARLISRQLVFGVGRQVEVELRQKLFDQMLQQEPGWVQQTGSGEVISRATSDVENVRRLLGFAVLSLTNTVLAYTFTLPAMLAIDPVLTVAAISPYPVMLGAVRLFGGRMMREQRRQQEELAGLSELIQEDLSGIAAIKIYSQEQQELNAFSSRNRRYRDTAIQLARTRSTLFPLLEGISSISLLLLLALGSGQLQQGTLSIGGMVALIFYVGQLVFPTALLGFTLNTFQTGQVSLERVEELLSRRPLISDPHEPEHLKLPVRGELQARNLHIRYDGSDCDTLNGLSFQIRSGELVAVVGPVGCGKTTLARALGRMVEVPAHQLFLDGHDITNLRLDDLREQIALVPQEGYLFTSSLADNLRYGEPEADMQRVEAAAEQARLLGDVRGFPDGMNTLVGERGITLSGGQRQRTALGRALLLKAPVLVLDDALASVDNNTAAEILASVRRQTQRTIVMISHQLSAAAACDRILVLDQGRLVQQGHHSDLIREKGLYRSLWEREQAAERLESVA
ncbi:putative multidrug resistance ABC transporter ATP-binding/permease protein YheI [Synechococcus sp. MIT S9509]|uniref:ABC transporter ATP-binding protein n=1 Tax=unclassified Synechococcus TaxID=2626047 RepID=UPI0007BB2A3A|nr:MULTISPECIES: ABC transporter ATP-binding protein [unclassified Synechococcus]KZR87376.1 putative multidrug resistance ABC transporter ATP-binding/permease protein YheI [Synechococcus sp. MIT S9504]KZR92778.1 putative multidrug resistance ABC transporter ATP-binding/permease protein YheI [Synechococcus sp. MIT S9509]